MARLMVGQLDLIAKRADGAAVDDCRRVAGIAIKQGWMWRGDRKWVAQRADELIGLLGRRETGE